MSPRGLPLAYRRGWQTCHGRSPAGITPKASRVVFRHILQSLLCKMTTTKKVAPNDWLSHPELLPPRPQTFTELKYTRLFAVDLQGRNHHDQYVFLAPNGLAVVGLAPSHPLISTHRKATGYTPLPFQYIPPNLESLSAEELVSPVADEDAEEGAQGGPTAADGAEPGAQGQVATDAQAEGGEAGTEAGGPTAGEAGAAGAPPGPAGSGGRGGPASQPEVRCAAGCMPTHAGLCLLCPCQQDLKTSWTGVARW